MNAKALTRCRCIEVHASATNNANLKSLEILIPERYCSVEISSKGDEQ